ncbi:hypothetical protein LguiB_020772 [Lonicera macranthoides]
MKLHLGINIFVPHQTRASRESSESRLGLIWFNPNSIGLNITPTKTQLRMCFIFRKPEPNPLTTTLQPKLKLKPDTTHIDPPCSCVVIRYCKSIKGK